MQKIMLRLFLPAVLIINANQVNAQEFPRLPPEHPELEYDDSVDGGQGIAPPYWFERHVCGYGTIHFIGISSSTTAEAGTDIVIATEFMPYAKRWNPGWAKAEVYGKTSFGAMVIKLSSKGAEKNYFEMVLKTLLTAAGNNLPVRISTVWASCSNPVTSYDIRVCANGDEYCLWVSP